MTARQAADGALHMEKYYLCERSIREEVRGDRGPPYFYICCHTVFQTRDEAIKMNTHFLQKNIFHYWHID